MVFYFCFYFSLGFYLVRQVLVLEYYQLYIFPSLQLECLTRSHAIHHYLLKKKTHQKALI